MATSSKDLFSKKEKRIAALAKALGHPARVAILKYLLKKNACVCGDLVDVLPLAQSTVSQHLKELKKVGILQGEIEGTSTCYCIDPKIWMEMKGLFDGLITQHKSCC